AAPPSGAAESAATEATAAGLRRLTRTGAAFAATRAGATRDAATRFARLAFAAAARSTTRPLLATAFFACRVEAAFAFVLATGAAAVFFAAARVAAFFAAGAAFFAAGLAWALLAAFVVLVFLPAAAEASGSKAGWIRDSPSRATRSRRGFMTARRRVRNGIGDCTGVRAER